MHLNGAPCCRCRSRRYQTDRGMPEGRCLHPRSNQCMSRYWDQTRSHPCTCLYQHTSPGMRRLCHNRCNPRSLIGVELVVPAAVTAVLRAAPVGNFLNSRPSQSMSRYWDLTMIRPSMCSCQCTSPGTHSSHRILCNSDSLTVAEAHFAAALAHPCDSAACAAARRRACELPARRRAA